VRCATPRSKAPIGGGAGAGALDLTWWWPAAQWISAHVIVDPPGVDPPGVDPWATSRLHR
jgi:hypothetical protein